MKKLFLLCICTFIMFRAGAQDTLTVMEYNLLHYSTSNHTTKNGYLNTIIPQIKPDILGVNEMYPSTATIYSILNNVLNTGGVTKYKVAAMTNHAASTIVNAFYYNSDVVEMESQDVIKDDLRDINVYKMYYTNEPNYGLPGHDRVYFYVIVAHLKAGEADEEAQERADQAAQVAAYLDALTIQAKLDTLGVTDVDNNFIMMGDFNLYTCSETAYSILTGNPNPDAALKDPINICGSWHDVGLYKRYHTQSTRATSIGDGGASGGMDDRFDFILCSGNIMGNKDHMKYAPNTYKAFGQDGLRFNASINSPANTVVSASVANALYYMSDHLPVVAKFVLSPAPAKNYLVPLRKSTDDNSPQVAGQGSTVRIYDLMGRLLMEEKGFYGNLDAWVRHSGEKLQTLDQSFIVASRTDANGNVREWKKYVIAGSDK